MEIKSHDYPEIYKDLDINLSKLGCVMLNLEPLGNMYSIAFEGADVALYYAKNPERFWIDGWVANKSAHITLLYGLMKEAQNYKTHIDKLLADWKIEKVTIDHIGYFDSPYVDEDYYCIVAHIAPTPDLVEGHQRLQLLPHIDTFPAYKPHMTLCYLSKSQGEVYRDELIKGFNDLWAGKDLFVSEDAIDLGGNK